MSVGSLIKCADPPEGLSDETLGVVMSFDGKSVTVSWLNGHIKEHSLHKVLWVENELFKPWAGDSNV